MSEVCLTRREAVKGLAVVAAGEKLTDGGFAEVSYADRPDRGFPVLPPGARNVRALARACVACGRCMAACPEKIIRPSPDFVRFGQPELDFRHGFCLRGCVRCGVACPTGAIETLQDETKVQFHIGLAEWRKDLCVRTTNGDKCTACIRKCPVRAIHLVAGFPVVDAAVCIGCGACEHVCPARPKTAIVVKGFDVQKVIRPISASDLLLEMRALIKSEEATVVLAKDGVIAAREKGRGIDPILSLFDRGLLRGAFVCDKVMGRASSAICVAGGATRVFAELMSADAAAFLAAHHVEVGAAQTVPQIDNHTRTGTCPMETAVKGLDDPMQMVTAIRKQLGNMKKGTMK